MLLSVHFRDLFRTRGNVNMNVDCRLNPPSLRNPLSFQNPFHYGGLSKNGRFAWSLDESSSLLSFSRLNGVSKTSLNTYCQFYTGGHQLESHGILEYDKKEYLVLVFAESAQSLVLVHSLGTGHLVRALKLPFHVSAVTSVSHMTLPAGLFISSPLQSFSGVIACGCGQTGRVVLIDLALAYSNLWPRPNLEYPREVKILPFGVEDLPVHSTNSIRDGVHLALHLNGNIDTSTVHVMHSLFIIIFFTDLCIVLKYYYLFSFMT